MTRKETIALNNGLYLVKPFNGRELSYAIKKNKKDLAPIMESFNEMRVEALNLAKEYIDEREAIQKEYATVDGRVKMKDKYNYDIPEDKVTELEAKIEDLKEKHKDNLAAQEKAMKEYEEFLDGECEYKIFKVKKHHVPEDISDENMDLIFDLIEDPTK